MAKHAGHGCRALARVGSGQAGPWPGWGLARAGPGWGLAGGRVGAGRGPGLGPGERLTNVNGR